MTILRKSHSSVGGSRHASAGVTSPAGAKAQATEGFAQHIHEMAKLKVLAANPQLVGRIRTLKVPAQAPSKTI